MPVICIGPVCIPWTCVPAIVYFLWRFAKPLLPQAWAAAIEQWAAKVCEACAPYLEKVPGFGKKKKQKEANGHAGNGAAKETFEPGEVGHIQSTEHLDALLQRSKAEGFAVVLDFTAPWCKPCQAIKPRFKALAADYRGHVFAEVDADELDGITARCEVMGLPTFQVYLDGERKGSSTGSEEGKLVSLVQKHLGEAGGGAEAKKAM
mmetsp:Transcript_83141/g.220609  ORF Transcript_83141/g.220609 Transcript_83141/m.220609 type:complete len:206 (-) Transcript_83141:126-743(-)